MTKAQRVLRFVIQYKRDHDGNSPTLREISDGLNIRAVSEVSGLLDELEGAGLVHRRDRRAAYIEVVGGTWTHAEDISSL